MSDFASQVLEAAAARPRQVPARPKTFADEVLAAAADRAPFSDVAQQAGGEFLRNAASVPATLGRLQGRVNRAVGGIVSPAVGEALAAQPEQIAGAAEKAGNVIPPVPGQEDKFYSHVAGMAGQAVALAPAALAGPGAVAAVGAGLGAEQGIEASQAAGGSTSDTVYSALGNAALQALTVYGPAGTLSRLGIKDATARSLIGEMLQGATVGTVQSLGSEGIAKATYDRQRVIDLGKALETGMAMATVSGGTGALVEIAALRNRGKSAKAPDAEPTAPSEPSASVLPEPVIQGEAPSLEQAQPELKPLASEPVEVQASEPGTAPGATLATPVPGRPVPLSPEAVPPRAELSSGGETAPPAAVPPEAAGGAPRTEEKAGAPEPDVPPSISGLAELDRIGPERAVALKHESTEAMREALGTDPRTGRTPKKDAEIHARALDTLRQDPHAGTRLVDELATSARIPSDEESMLLALELNRRRNVAEIAEPGPAKDAASKAFQVAADVTDALGSEAGAAFRMRRALIRADYSYAGMERKLREAKGEDLSAKDKADLEAIRERLTKAEKDVEDLRRAADEDAARQQFDDLKREVRARPRGPNASVQRSRARMDEILKELAAPTAGAQAFLDPHRIKLAAEFIGHAINVGVRTFADFVKEYGGHFDEAIRPKLQELWNDATKAHVDELAAPIRERMKAGEHPGRYMHELARHLVGQGVDTHEALVDTVHKLLPEMSREKVRDAISGYGQFKAASKEDADVRLREIKGELQKIAQIEALEKKLAPLKTGFERGEMSEEGRRLQKRVNDLRKQVGIRVVDPEKALKTALETRETRLRNRIDDLRHEIATGKLEARNKGEPPTNERIRGLEEELKSVEAEHKAVFAEPPKSASEKEAEALERQVAELDERIKRGDIKPRGPKQGPDVEDVAKLKVRRDELNERMASMRKAAQPPKPDPVVVRLEERRAQLEKKLAENDLSVEARAAGKPPSPAVAGLRRAIDVLNKQIAQLRREAEVRENPQVRQLRKQIERLDARIKVRDVSAQNKPRQGPDIEPVAALKAQRDALTEKLAEMRKAPPKTQAEKDAAKVKVSIRAVEKSIADYDARIAAGNIAPKAGQRGPTSLDLDVLRFHRDAKRAELDELRALANPKSTPEEIATKAYLTRVRNETARLRERESYGDFVPRTKVERVLSEPELRAKAERQAAMESFDRAHRKYLRESRTRTQKVIGAFSEALDVPKSFKSAFDLSAVLNQGGFLALGHPIEAARAAGAMFRSLRSEEGARIQEQRLKSDPAYEMSVKHGIDYTKMSTELGKHEEAIYSELAERIPIIGTMGIRASNRAFIAFLNAQRLLAYKRLMRWAGPTASMAEGKALANFVNVATGRGNVGHGSFARAMPAVGKILWAPRLYVSRFQLLAGQPFYHGSARTRAAVAADYGRFLVGISTVYGLAALYAAANPDDPDKPELNLDFSNPEDPDLMKIKMGDTRLDPWAGLAQTTRLVSQEGKFLIDAAQNEKSKINPWDAASQFVKYKVSPTWTTPYELATGRSFAFNKEKPRLDTAKEALLPLAAGDILKVMQDQGVPNGTALSMLALFGMRLQIYSDKKPARGVTAR